MRSSRHFRVVEAKGSGVRVLLDTCTFLWIAQDSKRLSSRAREVFRDPANDVFLSAASAWEIAVKNALGRLPLPSAADRWVVEMRRGHVIESLPLDETAALQVGKLPALHQDPFDRILVCQAIFQDLVILTPDEQIRQYPVRTDW